MGQFSTALPQDNSSAWKQPYECAMLELDKNKLPGLIAEARRAVYNRLEQILYSSSLAEHRALKNALSALRILEEVNARKKPAA